MIARILLCLVMTVTSLMLVVSPITGNLVSERMACAQQVTSTSEHLHMGHGAMDEKPDDIEQPEFVCCDLSCLFNLSGPAAEELVATQLISVPSQWAASDLADLAKPDGLSRPPRL